MKKTKFLIGAFLLTLIFGFNVKAQSPISGVDEVEQFFSGVVDTGTPVVLNRLGSSPQFGRIGNHTAESAYARLKSAYKSRRHEAELDRLFVALGYTGFEDLSFSEAAITPEILNSGTTGKMGSGGHKYITATFGRDFNGFRIAAKEGPAYVYLMQICGNIFHPPFPICDDAEPCPECNAYQAWTSNNVSNPFCACTPCPECQDTIDQTITITGAGDIASGDCVMGEKEVELVANYGGESLCLGTVNVPVNVAYEYRASGSTSASEVVTIDNQNGNGQSVVDLKIPVNLDFDMVEGQTSFGDNGAINMIVTAKRFAALRKIYPACPTNMEGVNMAGLSALEIDDLASTNGSATGSGVAGLQKQVLYFTGSDAISEVVSKEHINTITVIAHSRKTGKLVNGESADRYLCLGQYEVSGSSALLYKLTGASTLTKALEICSDGSEPEDKNINLPIDLSASFTKQEMSAGNDGKVYIEITEKQYNKLGKRFSKCCTNGDSSCF